MTSPFHDGEREMQRRFGVRREAETVGRIIQSRLPAGAGRFLARQRLAVAATVEADGGVWASLLCGPRGFISAVDDQLLHLAAAPADGDPFVANLATRPELGLLVFDPTTRQRMRFNGRGLIEAESLFLAIEQAYGNCPKYIQLRAALPDGEGAPLPPRVSDGLDARQQAWIAAVDTLFVASHHPRGGADASHRGGEAGFVSVHGPRRLSFPDYPGNAMFNTLGNLVANPAIGLLFVDFTSGDVLQASGRAIVGADAAVEVEIRAVREVRGACPLRYAFVESSPANPPLSQPGAAGI